MKEPEGKMLTYVAKTTRVFCLVTARASRAAVTTGAASMLTTRTTMATRSSRASMLTSRTARSTALVTARAAVVASFMAAGTAGTTLRAVLMFVMVVAEETHYVCVGVFMNLVDWRRGMRKMVMSELSISQYSGAFGTLL